MEWMGCGCEREGELGIEKDMWEPGNMWARSGRQKQKEKKETWEHGSMGEIMSSWEKSLQSTLFLGIYFRTTGSEIRTAHSHTRRIKSYQMK